MISLIYFCIDGFIGVICTSGPLYLTVQCALLDQPLVLLRMRYFQDQKKSTRLSRLWFDLMFLQCIDLDTG